MGLTSSVTRHLGQNMVVTLTSCVVGLRGLWTDTHGTVKQLNLPKGA